MRKFDGMFRYRRQVRFWRRSPRLEYDGEWTDPLLWVHPGAGIVSADRGRHANANRDLLAAWWVALDEEEQDRRVEDFARKIFTLVSQDGDARVYVSLCDRLGVEDLMAVLPPDARKDAHGLVFDFRATGAAIAAVVRTNPGPLYMRCGEQLVLSLNDDWESICLHVDDSTLLRQVAGLIDAAKS